jgi:hypothetical protein
MSITPGFGGNAPLYDILKEYKLLDETDKKKRYGHRALKWFKRRHLAIMDGRPFNDSKPVKDAADFGNRTKTEVKSISNDIGKGFNKVGKEIKDAKIGDKISGFWGKITGKKKDKKDENTPIVLPGAEEVNNGEE